MSDENTTGEMNFSSEGQQVKRFDNTPPAVKDWDFRLRSAGASQSTAGEPGAVPFINGVYCELIGSAVKEGEGNKRLYNSFFLSLEPGKDGVPNPNRGSGIVALAKALGESFNTTTRTMTTFEREPDPDKPGYKRLKLDAQGNPIPKEIRLLDPDRVKAILIGWEGKTGKLRSKIRKSKEGDRGEVSYFIEADQKTNVSDAFRQAANGAGEPIDYSNGATSQTTEPAPEVAAASNAKAKSKAKPKAKSK